MSNDVRTVALISGPLVLFAYLVGVISFSSAERDRDDQRLSALALEVVVTAALMTFVAFAVGELSPGNITSKVGLRSDQVLTASQSVAQWCGLAVVIGHVAPVTRGFRGGSGLVPAVVVTAITAPTVLLAGVFGFSAGLAVGGGRPRPAVPVGLAAALSAAWAGWVFEINAGWGVANGPELTLWTMVLAGALFARWHATPAD